MIKSNYRVGEKHLTKQGYEIEIIEYFSSKNCTIKFKDGNLIYNREYSDIKTGDVKNYLHRSLYKIGFIGIGYYNSKNSKLAYVLWSSMMCRCYNKLNQIKHPSYINCYVVKEWHNFQTFAKLVYENYNHESKERLHLDKDILIKGNKIYSPEGCCFVSIEINNLISINNSKKNDLPIGIHKQKNRYIAQYRSNGVPLYLGMFTCKVDAFNEYKKHKENHVKKIALKNKKILPVDVFNALMRFEININD